MKSSLLLPTPRGFTIIELVVVIVLLGIVGAVIVPRFLAPSTFNDIAARDGLVAGIRAAQQAALGRTTTTPTAVDVTFELDSNASDWFFAVKAGANTLRTFEVDKRDLVVETGSAAALSGLTCATGYDTAVDDFKLTFDGKGNLKNFFNEASPTDINEAMGDNFNGVRICVNDTDAMSVCVSRAGYAYVGTCDE